MRLVIVIVSAHRRFDPCCARERVGAVDGQNVRTENGLAVELEPVPTAPRGGVCE